jgi:hypothetical protein
LQNRIFLSGNLWGESGFGFQFKVKDGSKLDKNTNMIKNLNFPYMALKLQDKPWSIHYISSLLGNSSSKHVSGSAPL